MAWVLVTAWAASNQFSSISDRLNFIVTTPYDACAGHDLFSSALFNLVALGDERDLCSGTP